MNTTYLIFATMLLILYFLLLFKSKRKPKFLLRLFLGLIAVYGIALGACYIPRGESNVLNAWLDLLSFLVCFLASLGLMFTLFEEKKLYLLDTCLEGYAIQHICSSIVSVIFNHYKPFPEMTSGNLNWFLITLMVYPPIYALAVYAIYQMRKRYGQNDDIKVTLVAIPLLLICFTSRRFDDLFGLQNTKEALLLIYPIAVALLTLLLMSGILSGNKSAKEAELSKQMLEKEKEKYKTWLSSVDNINLKYHNLKYMLEDYKTNQDGKKLEKIEKSLMTYDNIIKTGNETLDLLLFDKGEECLKKNIEFSYLIDGKRISFMSKEDILVLFGNILDNAIEAVEHLPEEKRIISLKAIAQNGMLFLVEENYVNGSVPLENGLPKTTKKEKDFHGFGSRSIQLIAENYGGSIQYSSSSDHFQLSIAIPLKD